MTQKTFSAPIPKSAATAGFSLLELSIVLVISSFIVAAILGGITIKHNLQLQNIMRDISTLTQATEQFHTLYGGLPGDLWNATEKFNADNTDNGNGNGLIDTAAEQSLAFQHLGLAGLIKGNYPAAWSAASVMPGAIANSTYYFGTLDNAASITFTGIAATQETLVPLLTVDDMYSIDQKYDDGIPSSGNIRAFPNNADAGSCANGAAYNLANTAIACYFSITIRAAFQ